MANIRVHLLNFHGPASHIEIVLENTSSDPQTYFNMSRWIDSPQNAWLPSTSMPDPDYNWNFIQTIDYASSKFSFMIEADPDLIQQKWNEYWNTTNDTASCLGTNCAVGAQWFLTEFAKIPKPSLSNVSLNHLALGILWWPSFIPCPVTLPGRIMSNAKFYIEARDNPEKINQYSTLLLHIAMAAAVLTLATSALGIYVALDILTGGLASLALKGCVLTGLVGTYGFFSTYNKLSAKHLIEKKIVEPVKKALSPA
jgi:hypothetical protein